MYKDVAGELRSAFDPKWGRSSFAGVQGPHSPGAMRRTRRRHDHTTHAWYRHDFTRMVRGRCAAPAVYRSCSMVRGRCAAPVHYWSYTIPLIPPTRSTLACSGATPVPLSVRYASLVRRGAPDPRGRNPRGRHDEVEAPIAPPGERGRGPARPECCTVQGPQENGAGGANTSVTDLVELGVVAAQPSRLWGGRPLLRVTTRSGFSELFTLNVRGYCRNSSSFRSKPPSVEPKDSGPIRVERKN